MFPSKTLLALLYLLSNLLSPSFASNNYNFDESGRDSPVPVIESQYAPYAQESARTRPTPQSSANYKPQYKPIPQETGKEGQIELYPWEARHDNAPNRFNHQKWDTGVHWATCIHMGVGRRPPFSFSSSISNFLHGTREPDDPDLIVDEDDKIIPNKTFVYTAYTALHSWKDAEHCRAGCETCFDAMEENGALQAICRRRFHYGRCGMGVVLGSPLGLHLEEPFPHHKSGAPGHNPPNGVWGSSWHSVSCNRVYDKCIGSVEQCDVDATSRDCTLNEQVPRWAELGFESLDQAMRPEHDVRTYYATNLLHPDRGVTAFLLDTVTEYPTENGNLVPMYDKYNVLVPDDP